MKNISVIGATLVAAAVLCAAPISLHQSQDKGLSLSVDKARARIGRPLTPGSVAGVHRRYERRAYRGGYYGHGIMAKDIMATAARRRVRQRHSPVRRRPSSNSRRIGRPAAPTGTSASKPGRPRRPPKHNQQNKIEIAKKGTRFGSLSHLLQLVCPARRGGCLACERLSKNKTPTLRYTGGIVQATWG
jgi:hypothetical protein